MTLQFAPFIDEKIGDRFEREIVPTSRLSGIHAEAGSVLASGPVASFFNLAQDSYLRAFSPDKLKGVIEERDKAEAQRQDILGRMPSGFLSASSRFTGGGIGFALDPLGAASLLLAPEFVGTRVTPLLAGLAEKLPATSRAIRGAVEAGAAIAPTEVAKFAASNIDPFQDDYKSSQAIVNILLGMGIGGTLGVIFGKPIQPITTRATQESVETSVGQLASGNSVDVEPIYRKGMHDSRQTIPEGYESDLVFKRSKLTEDLTEIEKSIKSSKKDLSDTISSIPKDASGIRETLTGSELLDRISKSEVKFKDELIAFDEEILSQRDRLFHIKKASKIIRKHPALVTDEEIAFLRRIRSGEEIDIIQDRIDEISKGLGAPLKEFERLRAEGKFIEGITEKQRISRAKVSRKTKTVINKLQAEKDILTSRKEGLTKINENRIVSLNKEIDVVRGKLNKLGIRKRKAIKIRAEKRLLKKLESERTKLDILEKELRAALKSGRSLIEQKHVFLDDLFFKKNELLRETEDVDNALLWTRSSTENITRDQVKAVSDKMTTPEGESALSPQDATLVEEEGISPENIEDIDEAIEERFNSLKETDVFDDVDKELLDIVDSGVADQPKFETFINRITDCLLRNSR